jgi:glycosyltransferase involved in cell wall biosynthesis
LHGSNKAQFSSLQTMRKVRVAYIEQDSGIGGAEVNLVYLLNGINKDLFSPVVVVPYEGHLTERLGKMSVKYHVIPRFKFISTSTYILGRKIFNPLAVLYDVIVFVPTILKLSNYLKREGINVVHTNSMLAHIYGAIAAKIAGVPCIWHMQDVVDPKMAVGLARRALVFFGRILPEKIVVVSKAVGQMFAGKHIQKVQVVFNGTDTIKYSPEIDGSGIRKEFNISDEECVVGIVGRLVHWKGQKEFLRAAAVIADRIPNTRFLIVGDTTFGAKQYKEVLYNLACELGIESKVIFSGGRDDIPNIIRAMDVMVHASISPEPFGLVIIEGMASGVPVVASNRGGPVEIIEHGEDGFLVDPEETESVVNIVIELLKDKSLCKNIGEKARKKVVEQFSVEKFVRQFENIYKEAIN